MNEILRTTFTTQGLQDLQVPIHENGNVDHVAFDEGDMGVVHDNSDHAGDGGCARDKTTHMSKGHGGAVHPWWISVTPTNSFSLAIIQINEFVTVDRCYGTRSHSVNSVIGVLGLNYCSGH